MTEQKYAIPFDRWKGRLDEDFETHFYTLDAVTQLHYWINDSVTQCQTFSKEVLDLLTLPQFFLLTRHLVDLLGEEVTDYFLPEKYYHPEVC